MIDLSNYNPSVRVLLDAGIYVFPPKSASGKTFLYYTLKDIGSFERVTAYTYGDGRNLAELLTSGTLDLILLDRYDMYSGMCTDEIRAFSKHGVVLIACKSNWPRLPMKMCSIDLTRDGVVIS